MLHVLKLAQGNLTEIQFQSTVHQSLNVLKHQRLWCLITTTYWTLQQDPPSVDPM